MDGPRFRVLTQLDGRVWAVYDTQTGDLRVGFASQVEAEVAAQKANAEDVLRGRPLPYDPMVRGDR